MGKRDRERAESGLIFRGGKLVTKEAFYGFTKEEVANLLNERGR